MPDFIPYTGGTDLASAAGDAMGRARSPGALGSFMQGFQPGLNSFFSDMHDDRRRQQKIDRNQKFLADLESKHPEIARKHWWPYVHGVGDEGGDVNGALFKGMELDRHEKDQADSAEIRRMLAESQVDRRQGQTANDALRMAELTRRNQATEGTAGKLADSTIDYRGGLIDLGRGRLVEQGRHNQATEGIAQQNANRPRGKSQSQHELDQAIYDDKNAGERVKAAHAALAKEVEYPNTRDKDARKNAQERVYAARRAKASAEDAVREARKRVEEGAGGGGTNTDNGEGGDEAIRQRVRELKSQGKSAEEIMAIMGGNR